MQSGIRQEKSGLQGHNNRRKIALGSRRPAACASDLGGSQHPSTTSRPNARPRGRTLRIAVRTSSTQCLVMMPDPPTFLADDIDGIVAFFNEYGYAVIRNAMVKQDVDFLNAFCNRSQKMHPHAWGLSGEQHFYHEAQGLIYSQPLLDHPELDRFIRLDPGPFPAIQRILQGEARYSEFNFRETPEGGYASAMPFHHDRVLQSRLLLSPNEPIDDVCCITYLTDVTSDSPAFCVVPKSGRYESIDEAKAQLKDEYVEHAVYGPAGTCVLYNIAIFHTRIEPQNTVSGCQLKRRTLHQYFARGGWRGNRPPAPALTDWNLIPERLALSSDPASRKFFSSWNTGQCEWAADGFSLESRARHPRALGAHVKVNQSKI